MKLPENRPRIRVRQIWKKKDSGNVGVITRNGSGTAYISRIGSRKSHHMRHKDIYLFWELMK